MTMMMMMMMMTINLYSAVRS